MRQHCLCLIVRSVRCCDARDFPCFTNAAKNSCRARRAASSTFSFSRFARRRSVHALDEKFQPMPHSASFATNRSIRIRCAAQLMIQMNDANHDAEFRLQLQQQSRSSATESAPPETAAPTRSPARNSGWRYARRSIAQKQRLRQFSAIRRLFEIGLSRFSRVGVFTAQRNGIVARCEESNDFRRNS